MPYAGRHCRQRHADTNCQHAAGAEAQIIAEALAQPDVFRQRIFSTSASPGRLRSSSLRRASVVREPLTATQNVTLSAALRRKYWLL
jgi:hypothetical protein